MRSSLIHVESDWLEGDSRRGPAHWRMTGSKAVSAVMVKRRERMSRLNSGGDAEAVGGCKGEEAAWVGGVEVDFVGVRVGHREETGGV